MVSILLFVLVPIALLLTLAAITVRPIRARQGVIVCQGLTGRVVDVYTGPRMIVLLPGIDEAHRVDMSFHRTTLSGLTVQTFDGLSAVATVTVGWELDGAALQAADIERILPFLPEAEDIVTRWTEFITRTALSRHNLDTVQNILRHPAGFQTLLAEALRQQVEVLGVRVYGVMLMCYASPAVAAARVAAEARAQELQTIAAARANEIRLLSDALQSSSGGDNLLRLLTLDTLREGNKHIFTTLDMGGTGSGGGNGSMPVQFVVGHDQ